MGKKAAHFLYYGMIEQVVCQNYRKLQFFRSHDQYNSKKWTKCANLGTLCLINTKKLKQAGQKQFSFHSQRKRAFSKNDDVIENDDVIKFFTAPK